MENNNNNKLRKFKSEKSNHQRELTPTNCTRDLKNNWSEMLVFAAKPSEKATKNWLNCAIGTY